MTSPGCLTQLLGEMLESWEFFNEPGILLDWELFLVEQNDRRSQIDYELGCNIENLLILVIETN